MVAEVVEPGRRAGRPKRVGRPVDAQDVCRHAAAQVAAIALGQQHDLRDQYGQPVLTVPLRRAGE